MTQPEGQLKIRSLGAEKEFGVEVITPDELKARIDSPEENRTLSVGSVIEGPVFKSELMEKVDLALENAPEPVPLTMIPEYGVPLERRAVTHRKALKKLFYERTLLSGLSTSKEERGILESEALTSPVAREEMVHQLDDDIKTAIFGESVHLSTYQENTELSLQYSHDTRTVGVIPSFRFLKTHVEFVKGSTKHQDVVMVGGNIALKRESLINIKSDLLAQGFTRVEFYDSRINTSLLLHDDKEAPTQKTYRVIYTNQMSHPSMMACTALSGLLMGSTGDQSFSEAISANKIISYELMAHKARLAVDYDKLIKASGNAECIEAATLLCQASTSTEYERLGVLLRKPEVQEAFKAVHQTIKEKGSLSSHLSSVLFLNGHQTLRRIFALIKSGAFKSAWEMFSKNSEALNVFEDVDEENLYELVTEPPGSKDFQNYFTSHLKKIILDAINAESGFVALQLLKKNRVKSPELIGDEMLLSSAYAKGMMGIYSYLVNQELLILLEENKQVAMVHLFFKNRISTRQQLQIMTRSVEGKSILQRVFEKSPEGYFIECFKNEPQVKLYLSLLKKNEEQALEALKNIPMETSIWGDKELDEFALELGFKKLYQEAERRKLLQCIKLKNQVGALKVFEKFNDWSVFDTLYGESILEHALKEDPQGALVVHVKHDPDVALVMAIFEQNSEEVLRLMRARNLTLNSQIGGTSLHVWGLLFGFYKLNHVYEFDKLKQTIQFPRQESALTVFKYIGVQNVFFERVDGKTILQQAFEKNPKGALILHGQTLPDVALFIAIMTNDEKTTDRLLRERQFTLDSKIADKTIRELAAEFGFEKLL